MTRPTAPPLWRQISDDLRARIDAGRYADAFPGELAVAEEFGVSRGTARAALRPLREAGLISASRGRRPTLTQIDPASQYGAIYSLRDLIASDGMQASSTVLSQQIVREPEVATRLSLGRDEPFFHLERIRLADNRPVAHDEIYAPAALAAPLMEADFARAAFYAELRERCGIVIHGGSERIGAEAAGAELATMLDVATEAPLLLVERLGCSNDRPVEFRRTRFVGDRFSATRTFGSSADGGPCHPTPL